MTTIKLTRLGDLARRYGVLTSAKWWQQQARDINRLANNGEDWELALHERQQGLAELLSVARRVGLDGLTRTEDQ